MTTRNIEMQGVKHHNLKIKKNTIGGEAPTVFISRRKQFYPIARKPPNSGYINERIFI
jgi:hypothetical protein